MNLKINESFYISDITQNDKAAFLEHLKEKQISDQTLNIPFPYTEADADWWINHNLEITKKKNDKTPHWAIRRASDNYLVGGIGFHTQMLGSPHIKKSLQKKRPTF